jgi:hypothetical protein
MAQSGATPIFIYSSSTPAVTPAAANLVNSTNGSEIAINIADGKIFYKDTAGVVQVIADKALLAVVNALSTGLINNNLRIAGTAYSSTQSLTDGATITWNTAPGNVAKVVLGGNRIFAAPTNLVEGAFYSISLIQDSTGSRTVAWDSIFKFTSGSAPTLSKAANARDYITFKYTGTYLDEQWRSLGDA